MEKNSTSKNTIKSLTRTSKKDQKSKKDEFAESLRVEISQLSYEDSLNQLDILLAKLKDESLLVEDLQESFLQGSLYIKHCESLLDKAEQEVIEINENDLT